MIHIRMITKDEYGILPCLLVIDRNLLIVIRLLRIVLNNGLPERGTLLMSE